jgi:O-antigen/teichoic acid export membrane protein
VSDHVRDAESGGSLGASALREASLTGVRWTSVTRLIAEVLTFGAAVVLARLIAPAEFGNAAVAIGIAQIAPAVASTSFGVPLIQMRTLDRSHTEAAMILSVGTGLALTLATIFVISPLAIEPVFGSRVASLLSLASPIFVLVGIGTVPNALLQRELRFRRLSEIEIASIIVAPPTSISLAAAGVEAESLVLGGVATATIATLLTVVSAPRVGFGWRRGHARDVAGVGLFAALTSLIFSLSRNAQYAILGTRLPARDVGLFWRAYQLAVDYQGKMSDIAFRLAFPLFSRSGNLDEMRHLRSRILQVQSIVSFPLLTTLIVLAPELVPLVFGGEWEDAAFPTQVLAVAGMATVAASAGGGLAFAAGKARPVFYLTLIQLSGFVAVIVWTSGYGLRAVVIAIAVYHVVRVAAQFVYLESREVGIPLRETWEALVPASVASGASLAVSYPAVRLLFPEGNDVALVLAGGAFSLGLYALVLRVAFPANWFVAARLIVELARPRAGRVAAEIPSGPADRPAALPRDSS